MKVPSIGLRASVVIPTHGRWTELARCLGALEAQTLPASEFEILVCDDGSPRKEGERIRRLCAIASNVRYLRQRQQGPASARNLGIAHAKADLIAFTDSDTIPDPDWLESLLAPFADPEVAAVEGPVRTPRPARSPLEEAPRNEGGAHLTANMAYRRRVLHQVGGFDPNFPFAAFEDVDLALSVGRWGRIVHAPGAVVLHPWRRMTLGSSLRRIRQLDWMLVTAMRHGCLGWRDRPTRYPRLRVALAAAVTLPLGRFRKGARWLRRSPRDAMLRMGFAVIEAAAGAARAPWFLFRSDPLPRPRALHALPSGSPTSGNEVAPSREASR